MFAFFILTEPHRLSQLVRVTIWTYAMHNILTTSSIFTNKSSISRSHNTEHK
jgi:hypothetical protein